ncbi:transposable element Tcb2 transposase [Trichonephila clavipes]|nr:transposable element Tcb2 transposase [Trichonephila clavipes]
MVFTFTEAVLIQLQHDIILARERKEYFILVALDIKAAYDSVWPNGLVSKQRWKLQAGRRAVLLARWIVRCVPLELVRSSGHEKVRTCGIPGLERPGRPRGERIEGSCGKHLWTPTLTRSTIRADVGVAIPPQIISRHLAEANLKSKRPFRALPLTPEHRQLRLQWCQARSMWNVTDWQKVVFSDESRFVLGTDDNRVRVWMRPAYDSRSTLIVMRGTLTGQRYVDDILRPHVGPFLNGLPGAILQQDNARPHTARVAQDFLRHFRWIS